MHPSLLTQPQGMPVVPVMVTNPPSHPQRPSSQDGGSLMAVFTGPEDQLHHPESTGVKRKHRLWSGLPPSVEVKEEPLSHPAESVLCLSVRQVGRGQGNSAPS